MKQAILLMLVMALPILVIGATINVPADQPTIQAGINTAVNFDTVLVAPGIYSGDGNRDIDLLGKSVYLKGGGYYGSDVIIQCGGTDVDQHIGIWIHTGEDSNTVVDGFTITGAYKLQTPGPGYLGAIYCDGTSPKILNCTVADNAHHGISIFNLPSSLVGSTLISDCRVERNLNGIRVGRVPMFGGANVRILRTIVLENDSCGIQLFDHGDHYIENCLVGKNTIDGIYKFVDMPKPQSGTVVGQDSYVRRTIVFSNGRYGLSKYWVGSLNVECTDSYGNLAGNFSGTNGSTGDALGNISDNPQFCYPDTGNYFLRDNSSCAAGNNICNVNYGPFPVKCTCCKGTVGNVNGSLMESPDLSDLSLLISYLTSTPRPKLPCPAEANTNGIWPVDISDLSRLIASLTGSPITFPPCPVY